MGAARLPRTPPDPGIKMPNPPPSKPVRCLIDSRLPESGTAVHFAAADPKLRLDFASAADLFTALPTAQAQLQVHPNGMLVGLCPYPSRTPDTPATLLLFENRKENPPQQHPMTSGFRLRHPFRPDWTREGYIAGISRVREYLAAAEAANRPMRDNCRVVLTGAFCEQPPLNLIKSLEMSGCYIVDDDLMLVSRWLLEDVPTEGDPIEQLSRAFLLHSAETAAKYEVDPARKGSYLIDSVRKRKADGVIFAAPSFCDPALLDKPMIISRIEPIGIPYIHIQYAENSSQMQPIREQSGTFADSIKLWSAS